MKAFTILTAVSSMAVGLQVVLGVPLATADERYNQGKSVTQREVQDHCKVVPNGQFECSEKREVTNWAPCWDPDRGEIECEKVEPKNKRVAQSDCFKTSDGQIRCTNNKRQAETDSVPPPAPTNAETSSSCAQWYTIRAPDDSACTKALADSNIALADFRTLNPFVNEGCTNLWVGYTYCIRKSTSPQASSPPAASTPAAAPPALNSPAAGTPAASPTATAPPASSPLAVALSTSALPDPDPPVASPLAATPSPSSPPDPNTPDSSTSYGTSNTGTMQLPDRVTQYYHIQTSTATPVH